MRKASDLLPVCEINVQIEKKYLYASLLTDISTNNTEKASIYFMHARVSISPNLCNQKNELSPQLTEKYCRCRETELWLFSCKSCILQCDALRRKHDIPSIYFSKGRYSSSRKGLNTPGQDENTTLIPKVFAATLSPPSASPSFPPFLFFLFYTPSFPCFHLLKLPLLLAIPVTIFFR